MELTEWAIILSLATSVLLAIRWMVKYYLHELQPNSGSSIKDQVTRIEARQDKQEEKIDRILFLLAGDRHE
jgi:hypothetical protein